ncbi:DNA polymerase III subunit delta [Streptococcus cuniculipharyngis]|uniref:DNA polymerase III subunit delta n=1 Tax=Streptococcus cuniculipharyngis TaxID=1562651 RepID=A0A5C5SFE3_9STRE|nr:DNA polymerase III subunit delta [Streptococcus cuniculipharyngis]TWS98671.1 DNA polymerase III subunit delta [Streptococcus cuniculipharyngis]
MIVIETVKQLSRATLPQILVLAGDDSGQYRDSKSALFEAVGFDPSDLTYSYFDLEESSFEEAALDLESLPFFADEKVVILDNLSDITTDKKKVLDDAQLKQFEDYLLQPVASTRLIICAPGKLDGKRRLVKLLKRDALVLEANSLKEQELRQYLERLAQKRQLTFAAGALEDLLIKSNFDFSESLKNLAFLETYKGREVIEQADIIEAIPKSLQDNIFDLTQYVLTGKLAEARELSRDLSLQGEDVIKLLAIMLGQLRFWLQVKLLAQANKSEAQLVADLSDYLGRRVNPYQVKFALRDSKALSLAFLKKALVILIDTDYQIKTGRYDKDYLFDLALLKLTYEKNG